MATKGTSNNSKVRASRYSVVLRKDTLYIKNIYDKMYGIVKIMQNIRLYNENTLSTKKNNTEKEMLEEYQKYIEKHDDDTDKICQFLDELENITNDFCIELLSFIIKQIKKNDSTILNCDVACALDSFIGFEYQHTGLEYHFWHNEIATQHEVSIRLENAFTKLVKIYDR